MLSPRELARSITALENNEPTALDLLHSASRGGGLIVGITGPPGAGKSTLVDVLAQELRKQGRTVAILAVDPSSRSTGGAILGDRIRMQQLHKDRGIFARSMATRGNGGGLARSTENVSNWLLCQGFDFVVIETVGVGQDEIAVAEVADVVVVVLVPGMGDDVQAIKAGVMEIADVFVVNKADRSDADRTVNEVESMLGLAHGPRPPVLKTIATEPRGIGELVTVILQTPRRNRAPANRGFSLDHLGIAVDSIEHSLKFYELLGLRTGARESVPHERVTVQMVPFEGSRVELLEASAPDSPISRFLSKRGEGLHHVAVRVPNLANIIRTLEAAGIRLLNTPRQGAGGHLYVFVHPSDTGNVLWELIQN